MKYLAIGFLVWMSFSCKNVETKEFVWNQAEIKNPTEPYVFNKEGKTILDRFPAPSNYKVVDVQENSFGSYLQNLPLKPFGEKVKYFNGKEKPMKDVYISVIDMDISKRDLQQCADAVMRLKAEYHYHRKEYDKIHFNFLSDGKPRYFKDYAKGDFSYQKFLTYMDYVMAFANTASLKDELEPASIQNIEIGDVFIQKGNPYGHAVIVVNVAEGKGGEKQFMLAQSYMPAQETQILLNPKKFDATTWYEAKIGEIKTPEWSFNSGDLRRFK